jgi:hypothetical protein
MNTTIRKKMERESRLKRRNLAASLFPENVGVQENRRIFLCKASGGDTDVHCGYGVRSGSILLRICYPCVAAGLSNESNSKLHVSFNFHLRCRHQWAGQHALPQGAVQ